MGIRISKDHLHPSVIESITSLIGDLNQLETTAKGNAVEAINELLANGGNNEELEALIAELKSILEDEGVDVTEEDDMASLISKTDNLIATLNDNALVLDSTFESGYDVSIFSSDGNYTSSTADWNLVLCIDVKRPGTYNCSFNAKTNSSGNMCTVDLYYPNTTEGNCIYSKSFSSTTAVTCSKTFTFDTPGQLYFNLTCPVSYYQAILSDIVLKSKINL